MIDTNDRLDRQLDIVRNAPAFIRIDASTRFVQRRIRAVQHIPQSRFVRSTLLLGGTMAAIAILAFVITSFLLAPSPTSHVNQNAPPTATMKPPTQNDSLRLHRADTPARSTQRPRPAALHTDSPTQSEADQRANWTAPLAHFVNCTPDRIDAVTVYTLDADELRRLGIELLPGWIRSVITPGSDNDHMWRLVTGGISTHVFRFKKNRMPGDTNATKILVFRADSRVDTIGNEVTPSDAWTSTSGSSRTEIPKGNDSRLFGPYIWPLMISGLSGHKYEYNSTVASLRPPVITITHDAGKLFEQRVSGDSVSQPFTDFIAIRITPLLVEGAPAPEERHFIYWYAPTPDFLSALPERVRRDIRNRNELNTRRIKHLHSNDKIPTTLEASVHPNPITSDVATVQYSIATAAEVAVSLYDINGRQMKALHSCEERQAGTWENNISVSSVPPGVYLLAVTTAAGEQSVQKVVIQR